MPVGPVRDLCRPPDGVARIHQGCFEVLRSAVLLVMSADEHLADRLFRCDAGPPMSWIVRPNVKLTGILRWAVFGLGFYSPNAARRKMSG